jgi:septal ring factor EnvC (AmiA/AmiB activator)
MKTFLLLALVLSFCSAAVLWGVLCFVKDAIEVTLTRALSAAAFKTNQRLEQLEKKLMSEVTDAVAQVKAVLTNVSTGLTTLSQDITDLKNQLASGGKLSTEDEAAIADLEASAQALANQTAAAVTAGAPTPPAAPPTTTT